MKFQQTITVGIVFLTVLTGVQAMNHNLVMPWNNPPKCSPPQTPVMSFYNRENTTMLFEAGNEIELFCQAAFRQSTGMTYSLHHNGVNEPILSGKAEDLPANLFRIRIDTKKLRPGFYDVKVKYDCGFPEIKLYAGERAVKPEGVCTFGWKIKEMPIPDNRPKDFRKFWNSAMNDYRKIPLNVKIESPIRSFKGKEIDEYNMKSACLPGNFDPEGAEYDEVVSYKISFAGPDGGRVYAWLARPKANGRFPAMLILPGAGNNQRPRPLDHARHGYVAIDIQVHGFDVELDPKSYPDFAHSYFNVDEKFDPSKKTCWHNIYLRAARGVDFLASLPEVDAKRIVSVGGSQGGRLSIVVPALDQRVAATVPCITHGGNYPHLSWVRQCNARKSSGEDLKGAPPQPDTLFGNDYRYYDPMNFAPDIRCPVYFNAGLIDPVSPAYATWPVFRRIASADKTFVPLAGLGHDWSASFDRSAYRWLKTKLNSADSSPETVGLSGDSSGNKTRRRK